MNFQNSSPSNSVSPIYFQGPIRRQNFSLPDSVIYYIAKNPSSSKVYQKIIQSCKYFFAKNSIIVLSCLHYTADGWKTCLKKCRDDKDDYVKFYIEKISKKIWISQIFDLRNNQTITPPSIISKIYQSDVKGCTLFRQNITLNELLFLASNVANFNLRECTVKDENGSAVSIEKIITNLPKIKNISMDINSDASNISKNTVKELLKIQHFFQIERLFLVEVPDSFDIENIYEYLKSTQNNFRLCLIFRQQLSEAYVSRLEAIVDDMLETSTSFNYIFPYISIPNLDQNKRDQLYNLYSKTKHFW